MTDKSRVELWVECAPCADSLRSEGYRVHYVGPRRHEAAHCHRRPERRPIRWNDRARKLAALAFDVLALLACALLIASGALILGSL